jgi:hypothetical protein
MRHAKLDAATQRVNCLRRRRLVDVPRALAYYGYGAAGNAEGTLFHSLFIVRPTGGFGYEAARSAIIGG